MKKIFKQLAVVLIFALLLTACGNGMTAMGEDLSPEHYTALGDSIATGYGVAKEDSYTELFYNYLKTDRGFSSLEYANLAVNGDDSTGLLNKLKTDERLIKSVKESDIITISIGGNNILQPIIQAVGQALNIDVSAPDYASQIQDVLSSNPESVEAVAGMLILGNLPKYLNEGISRFENEWPEIINTVRSLAPEADIFVMNIYNPLSKDDVLYNLFDTYIQKINTVINKPSPNYRTADVYNAFNEYNEDEALTKFNILKGSFDPHPTEAGHIVVFNSYRKAYEEKEKHVSHKLKRGEAVSILVKELELKADFTDNFKDVQKSSTYYEAVGIARKLGIVAGKGQNKFYPEDYLTREEAMVIFEKTMIATGKSLFRGSPQDLSDLDDASSVSSYAKESIASLYKSGIVSFGKNKIYPKEKMSYYDFMNIIYNMP
mgnify:FL=1